MRKFEFATNAIDAVVAPLFPRDSEDAIRELVERSVVRVFGEDLDDLDIDLDEIADAVVIEEFNNLSPEQRSAANRRVSDAVEERLKEMIRENVKSILRS